jgi:hypothetical protein
MRDIWKENRELEKEHRDLIEKLMEPYEESFRQRRLELMRVCEEQNGHNFSFSHLGPLGHAWSYCTKCGKSKVDD